MRAGVRPPGRFLLGACLALSAAWCFLSEAGSQGGEPRPVAGEGGNAGARGLPGGWSPATLQVQVPSGGQRELQVNLSSLVPLTDVRLQVVPELTPYVSVSPQTVPAI